ncbi:conserved hypothetical protein [Ricinus communis]|uniref:Uncharacterized protein n=1 Tax=Ricinus communis TaxID=3988 RepID=B9S4X5_RICCO|nr:conserved hypothetical protein [Ricinus communis]
MAEGSPLSLEIMDEKSPTKLKLPTLDSFTRARIQNPIFIGENETSRSYLERFSNEATQIENLNVEIATKALQAVTQLGKLIDKLYTKNPNILLKLMAITRKYVELDKGRKNKRKMEAAHKNLKRKDSNKKSPKPREKNESKEKEPRYII